MKLHIRNVLAVALLATVLVASGCSGPDPRLYVFVIDVSRSISRDAIDDARTAVRSAVSTARRGDRITVILVASDARAETPGTVLRYVLPTEAEPWDDDLRLLTKRFDADLDRVLASAVDAPPMRTDLLGAIRLASEDVSANRPLEPVVVILSDLIQDDASHNFGRQPEFATVDEATELANAMSVGDRVDLAGADVYLGSMRSDAVGRLAPARRDAIVAFWTAYMHAKGTSSVRAATDGPGALDAFLRGLDSHRS